MQLCKHNFVRFGKEWYFVCVCVCVCVRERERERERDRERKRVFGCVFVCILKGECMAVP